MNFPTAQEEEEEYILYINLIQKGVENNCSVC